MLATLKTAAASGSCKKKLSKSKSGLRIVPVNNTERSPFELREPIWSSDKESVSCSSCSLIFDLLRRRHHCRRCGLVFCDRCCDRRVSLTRMCFVDPVRQCEECASRSDSEELFFARRLKLLVTGAEFYVEQSAVDPDDDRVSQSCECYSSVLNASLSSDHRQLVFNSASYSHTHTPLFLDRVESVNVSHTAAQYNDDVMAETVVLLYRPVGCVLQSRLRLTAGPRVANWQQSAQWINALEEAMDFVYQSRKPSDS